MDMGLATLLTSFTLIFLAELGDKTQICTIILSSKASASSVFFGAMLAFLLVDGLSALLGGELLALLPRNILSLATGFIFIIFGLISLLRKSEGATCEKTEATLMQTFLLVSLMELGDKTQFSSILLAAKFENPLFVLVGIMLAFTAVTAIGVFLGYKILRFIPEKYLRIGASTVFVTLGLIFLLEALLNVRIMP